MQEFYTLVTKIGVAAIANATILGQKVNITNFSVGDGAGNYYTPTAEMTELKREVWRGKPTSVEIDPQNPNMMVVSTVIPADIGGFTIREMALFTEDGKMIAISNCPELQKVTLGTGVASELALTMQIAVSNAETIEFKIDPTVIIATKSDIEKAKEELEIPTFDDSGTVPTIQSFTDFVNSIKSKMNIFEFYRNFKSGMKYILDTGRIVNNVATDREDMVLSAAMGKYLQEQIDQQNNNLIYENIKPLNSLMEKPIKPADYGVYCEDGSFPATYGYFQLRYGVSKGEYCGFFHDMLGNELYTNVWRYGEQKWAGWNKAILNSDLETHEISLQNNWVWSSGSLKMQKVLNCVFLEFEAINGSTTEKTPIAIIPEGWRPFQWKTTIGVSGVTPVNIIIGTDGNIYCHNTLPTNDIVINTMWMIK